MSTRTIFLYIRGIDQTGRAFDMLDRRMKKLIQNQMYLYKVSEDVAKKMLVKQAEVHNMLRTLENASYRLLFAGAAFTAFGAMFMYAIGRVIGASSMGELYVEDFNRAMNELITGISETILTIWGPAIQDFIGWLDELAQDETFKMIIAGVAPIAAITITAMGVTLLVTGIVGTFVSKLMNLLVTLGYISEGQVATALIAGKTALSFVIPATILIVATLVLKLLKEEFERQWKEALYGPRWEELPPPYGKTPIGGGIDIGEVIGGIFGWIQEMAGGGGKIGFPTGQLGIRFIPRTGPIMAHEGEMLFNPQLPITPPLQMRGMMGRMGPIVVNLTQYIDSIGVEADEDRLAQKTAEVIADKITGIVG